MMTKQIRLLVMEDDPTFLGVICAWLKDRGHRPIPCSVADHFLKHAVEDKPDLIVLDAHLKSSVDGLRLCSALKQDRNTRHIPVLMMSGVFSGEYAAKAIDHGAAAFLQKPFPLEELERHIDRLLDRPRQATILWLEDDDEYRHFGVLAFKTNGMTLIPAPSLVMARRLLAQSVPDLVLLDAHLPDGSGISFCRELRADPRFRETTIAVLTGQRRVWNDDEWFAAGADQCWTKTFNGKRLVALVRGLLGRRASKGQSDPISIPGLSVDAIRRIVAYKKQCSPRLSQREFLLFDMLARQSPRILPREAAHTGIPSLRGTQDPELALNTLVSRLRRKLPAPIGARLKVVRGVGYLMEQPAETGE